MRKLMRSIARYNMEKAGIEHLNKNRFLTITVARKEINLCLHLSGENILNKI